MTGGALSEEVRRAAAALLTQAGCGALQAVAPLSGGRNNRVYRLSGAQGVGILKQYEPPAPTGHDRFAAEVAWYRYCQTQAIARVPAYWGSDPAARCALFAEAPGRKLRAGEVQPHHVAQAADFLRELNAGRRSATAAALPLAAEAAFSLTEHLQRIDGRIARLRAAPATDDLAVAWQGWLRDELAPTWQELCADLERTCPPAARDAVVPAVERCLSPSDFGFHNALVAADGSVRFVDFEYAGWDDPAKVVCDFYWQVDVPAPRDTAWRLLSAAAEISPGARERVIQLFAAYGIKWCTIVLNEFLAVERRRREFALGSQDDLRPAQWDRARRLLADVQEVRRQGVAAVLQLDEPR